MRILQVFLCTLLGSCALPAKIVKPKFDNATYTAAHCEQEANANFPRIMKEIVITEEQVIGLPVSCKIDGIIRCFIDDEKKIIPAVKQTRDSNLAIRQAYIEQCIKR